MSRIIHIGSKIEFLHDNDPELYHAELLRLVEEHMGREFRDLIADELEELDEALRVADAAEYRIACLEEELENAHEEIDQLTEENW